MPAMLTAAGLTFFLLAVVQLKVARPMLIVERFWPGWGWLEIALLTLYAGWLTDKMADPKGAVKWRPRIWRLFTIVFFGQLLLGLSGFETFLMTGKLHFPIPAMIVAGPLYRGHGLFMPILFLSTVALVGPAWCSHLCYVGAWDDTASRATRRPGAMPRRRPYVRVAILVLVVSAALILRYGGLPTVAAMTAISIFGIGAVAVMVIWSRRKGQMTHCTTWCPIGLVANLSGKINPFRIRIDRGCSECMACTTACRYDALNLEDIQNRKPGLSCTLCGDCITRCRTREIHYRLLGLPPQIARMVFIVLVVTLHATFLGLARI